MDAIMAWTSLTPTLFLVNLSLQITILLTAGLCIAFAYKDHPIKRYLVLYSCLMSMVFLSAASMLLHSNESSLVSLSFVDSSDSTSYFDDRFVIEFPIPDLFILESESSSGLLEDSSDTDTGRFTHSWIPAPSSISIGLWMIWGLGVFVCLLSLGMAQLRLNELRRRSIHLDSKAIRQLNKLKQSIDFPTITLNVRQSNAIYSPVLVGMLSPTILVPEGFFEAFSDSEVKNVFRHELAHLTRNDIAANYLQQLVCAVFWIHPLVWVLNKQLTQAREESCDNYVLAHESPVNYGETLLNIGLEKMKDIQGRDYVDASQNRNFNELSLGVVSNSWSLEERIKGLLNTERETTMTLDSKETKSIKALALIFAGILAACQVNAQSSDQQTASAPTSTPQYLQTQSASDEPRQPPQARTDTKLSEEVLTTVQAIQFYLEEDENGNRPNLDSAKSLIDTLTIDKYETLNDFEKSTALNFLTNYQLIQEDYPGTIETFNRMLEIPGLRADIRLRALRGLGQLTSALEQWNASIGYYDRFQELSYARDPLVSKGLSYAHYQVEDSQAAIENWIEFMAISEEEGLSLERDDYAYLNGIYFSTEEYENALALTKEMILQFNDERDWANLRKIYTLLDAIDEADAAEEELIGAVNERIEEPELQEATYVQSDGDYLPLIAVAPQYPRLAAESGTEGWVLVSFNVLTDGLVEEESIKVIDADPVDVFNRASIRAATKFEFSPRIINGEPLVVEGVQYLFRYALEDEA